MFEERHKFLQKELKKKRSISYYFFTLVTHLEKPHPKSVRLNCDLLGIKYDKESGIFYGGVFYVLVCYMIRKNPFKKQHRFSEIIRHRYIALYTQVHILVELEIMFDALFKMRYNEFIEIWSNLAEKGILPFDNANKFLYLVEKYKGDLSPINNNYVYLGNGLKDLKAFANYLYEHDI